MNISPISNFMQTNRKNINFKGFVVIDNKEAINTKDIKRVCAADKNATNIQTSNNCSYTLFIPFREVLGKIQQADKNNEIVDLNKDEITPFL